MVSYKHLFLIKGMTLWNGLSDWTRWVGGCVYSWYRSVSGWFDPHATSWYLHSQGVFPVSQFDHTDLQGAWLYCPRTHQLLYEDAMEREDRKEKGQGHMLSWLSARIIGGETKDMDGFLERLRIYPKGKELPLMILLQAWSLYDRRWWLATDSARIEWIDRDAEEHSASVSDKPLLPLVPLPPAPCLIA